MTDVTVVAIRTPMFLHPIVILSEAKNLTDSMRFFLAGSSE